MERSAPEYDEEGELTDYIWRYFGRLMTEHECRVGRAIMYRMKAAQSRSPKTTDAMMRHWGGADDPEIIAALADGMEAFRRRVRDRLLAEKKQELYVNRCPVCGRLARTPRARQCIWCGFDWHSTKG